MTMNSGPANTNDPATETTLAAVKTAAEIMDDWDEGDRAKVNLVAGQAGVSAGAGAVAANTPRVTLASDDPAAVSLDAIEAVAGTTAGAAVITDANGTLQQYLRGLISLIVAANGLDVDVTREPVYTAPATGELAGSATAVVMPTVACRLVKFKAAYDNAGRVYIGIAGVTKKDGTTDTTTGFELSAGEETGWIPVDNLNRLYRISDNAGDDLTYLALA